MSRVTVSTGKHGFYAESTAHEEKDPRPAKGSLYQVVTDGPAGSFVVDVEKVYVNSADGACFGGITTAADGAYGGYLNQWRWTTVRDGGSGTDETGMEYLRGGWTGTNATAPSWCTSLNTASNEAWWGGNVQIHLGESYE